MSTISDESLLDGVPRDPLIPQVSAGNWDTFSFQNLKMYQWLYDAICKVRTGQITLIDPTASDNYTPTTDNNLVTVKAGNASATGYIKKSIFTGFGQLIVSHGDKDPRILANPGAGHNDEVLTLDDTQENGVKWAPASSSSVANKFLGSITAQHTTGSYLLEQVQVNTETYDIGGNFNTGTYLFTVPTTGYYMVSGQVRWQSGDVSGLKMAVGRVVTGALSPPYVYGGEITSDDYTICSVAQLMSLTAGMTLGMFVQNTTALRVVQTGVELTFFQVYGPI